MTVVYFLKLAKMFGQSERGRGSIQERTRAKPETWEGIIYSVKQALTVVVSEARKQFGSIWERS